MPRDFCKVKHTIWTGKTGRLLRGHADLQRVWFYLLTGREANMIGLYRCSPGAIADSIGMEYGACRDSLRILSGQCPEHSPDTVKDLCAAIAEDPPIQLDQDRWIVWIVNMAPTQIGQKRPTHNSVKSALALLLEFEAEFPDAEIISNFKNKHGALVRAPDSVPTVSGQCPDRMPLRHRDLETKRQIPPLTPPGGEPGPSDADPARPLAAVRRDKAKRFKQEAAQALEAYNRMSGRSLSSPTFLSKAEKLLKSGVTREELELVCEWALKSNHQRAVKLRDDGYADPDTLWGPGSKGRPGKFYRYRDYAREWLSASPEKRRERRESEKRWAMAQGADGQSLRVEVNRKRPDGDVWAELWDQDVDNCRVFIPHPSKPDAPWVEIAFLDQDLRDPHRWSDMWAVMLPDRRSATRSGRIWRASFTPATGWVWAEEVAE